MAWLKYTLMLLPLVTFIIWKLKKKKKTKLAPPQDRPTIEARKPGNGTPLFHGLRVVEIGNTIAVPMVGRLMAEHGAEVMKLEPSSGDYWRYWMLKFEAPRTQGSSFESANLGKNSVIADFRKTEDMQMLKDLLKNADVLITNTRPGSLDRLGLSQEEILKEFPHLVFAALCAWGEKGEQCDYPGYDLGAFWAASGLAASIMTPGSFQNYPVGFGDVTSASAVLGAINVALRRRCVTGQGGIVNGSLVRTGAFVLSALLSSDTQTDDLKATNGGEEINGISVALGDKVPDYTMVPDSPLQGAYATKDDTVVQLVVQEYVNEAALSNKLAEALSLDAKSLSADSVRKAIAKLSFEETVSALTKAGVAFERARPLVEIIDLNKLSEEERVKTARVMSPKLNDVDDIEKWVRPPFNLSCSSEHVPTRGAPALGVHTASVKRDGWSPILDEAKLPREVVDAQRDAEMHKNGPLCDVTVVELGGVMASGVGAMLADLGARVYVIEGSKGSVLRQGNPKLHRLLARGKRSVTLNLDNDLDSLHKLLAQSTVFLCDWERSKLKPLGLDAPTLHKKYPTLVVARSTTWGLESTENGAVSPLAAFWAYSALLSQLGGHPLTPQADIPTPPKHFPEFMAGLQLFAGTTAALFHRQRTGEGQVVDVNFARAGLWLHQVLTLSLVARDVKKADIFISTPDVRADDFPVPTASSFRSKDGQYVQLLGAELPRHLARTIKALGLGPMFWLSIVKLGIFKVALGDKKVPLIERVRPVFNLLNQTFRREVAKRDISELKELFAKHDVWYCLNRSTHTFKGYKQAHVNGAFQIGHDGAFLVSSPFDLDGKLTSAKKPEPKLGEHNSEL